MISRITWVIIGIVIPIIIAVIIYLKQKKAPKPIYIIRNNILIENTCNRIKDLDLTFKNNSIDNVVVTKIAFLNVGNESIDYRDVSTKTKLYFNIPNNSKILSTKIMEVIPNTIPFSIQTKDDSNIELIFQYLDKNQGVILQIIHTCIQTDRIKIIGEINKCKVIRKTIYSGVLTYTSRFLRSISKGSIASTNFIFNYCRISICILIFIITIMTILNIIKFNISWIINVAQLIIILVLIPKKNIPNKYDHYFDDNYY